MAGPAALDFTATSNGETTPMGSRLPETAAPVTFAASVVPSSGARVVLLQGGRELASGQGSVVYRDEVPRGAYRVEASYPNRAVPWIVSNPIYAGVLPSPAAGPPSAPPRQTVALDSAPTIESGVGSSGTTEADAEAARFTFALGGGRPAGQYAALVWAVDAGSGVDRVSFTVRANRPMRVSVQLRLGPSGRRWLRSVFVDQTSRDYVVPLSEFRPADAPTSQQPLVARVRAVLFVIDTLNSRPGDHGTVWVSRPALGVADAR